MVKATTLTPHGAPYMHSTCRSLFLQDILTPEPDWDAIAVYSDYLEDDGRPNRLALATILRWFRTYNHWPNYFRDGPNHWELYCCPPEEKWLNQSSRYNSARWISFAAHPRFDRCTLPPYFFFVFHCLMPNKNTTDYLCLSRTSPGKLFQTLLHINHHYPTLFLSDPTPYLQTKEISPLENIKHLIF